MTITINDFATAPAANELSYGTDVVRVIPPPTPGGLAALNLATFGVTSDKYDVMDCWAIRSDIEPAQFPLRLRYTKGGQVLRCGSLSCGGGPPPPDIKPLGAVEPNKLALRRTVYARTFATTELTIEVLQTEFIGPIFLAGYHATAPTTSAQIEAIITKADYWLAGQPRDVVLHMYYVRDPAGDDGTIEMVHKLHGQVIGIPVPAPAPPAPLPAVKPPRSV